MGITIAVVAAYGALTRPIRMCDLIFLHTSCSERNLQCGMLYALEVAQHTCNDMLGNLAACQRTGGGLLPGQRLQYKQSVTFGSVHGRVQAPQETCHSCKRVDSFGKVHQNCSVMFTPAEPKLGCTCHTADHCRYAAIHFTDCLELTTAAP